MHTLKIITIPTSTIQEKPYIQQNKGFQLVWSLEENKTNRTHIVALNIHTQSNTIASLNPRTILNIQKLAKLDGIRHSSVSQYCFLASYISQKQYSCWNILAYKLSFSGQFLHLLSLISKFFHLFIKPLQKTCLYVSHLSDKLNKELVEYLLFFTISHEM